MLDGATFSQIRAVVAVCAKGAARQLKRAQSLAALQTV
jgi:hypothetical protein